MLFATGVGRYVVPLGKDYAVDDDGFRSNSAWWNSTDQRALADVPRERSIAVLGEPGIGKTTAIGALVENDGQVVVVHLDEVADVRQLDDQLHRVSTCPDHSVTLVLDGVDECPVPAKSLIRHVEAVVREHPFIRVVIGCRTADWPAGLGESLKPLLGEFDVVELLPLAREDVAALAASRSIDGTAFLKAVVNASAVPLATLPLTLDLLLTIFAETGGLPASVTELYERGLLLLAEEPDPDRGSNARPAGTAPQRLATAAKIAAYTMLCGRSAVSLSAPAPDGDLLAGALAAGTEPIAGGAVPITADLVDAALSTALFSGRGVGRLGVVHASFAAYLTARYLESHDVAEHQLRALLTRTNTLGHTSVPVRLRETAAWLVALDPDQYGWLADVDPDTIAAHAGLVNDAGVRRALVAHLLNAPDAELRTARRQWRLAHPGLAEQLRPALRAPLSEDAGPDLGHPISRRARVAVEIARRAGERGTIGDLADLVSSAETNSYLRSAAAHALVDIDRPTAGSTLRTVLDQAVEHPEQDPDDELRGLALELNWPANITARELVTVLSRPQNRNLIGNYTMFLNRFLEDVPDEVVTDLVRAVSPSPADPPQDEQEWVDEEESDVAAGATEQPAIALLTGTRRGARVMKALVSRALESADLASIVDEAGWLVAVALNQHETFPLPVRFDAEPGAEDPVARELRLRLVRSVLTQTSASRAPYIAWRWSGSNRGGLVTGDDLEWLFSLAPTEWSDHAARLIRTVFEPVNVRHQEIAWAHHDEPIFEESIGHWFKAIALDSDEAARMREEHEWSSPKQKVWAGAPDHEPALREAWAQCETDTSDAFHDLCARMRIDPATGRVTWDDDLTSWPSYSLLPIDDDVLRAAAERYLAATDPTTEPFDKIGDLSFRAFTGYVALAYLARRTDNVDRLDALPDDVWRRWIAPLLWMPIGDRFGDQSVNEMLTAYAAKRVPDAYREWALRRTELRVEAGWHLDPLADLTAVYDEDVRQRLATVLRRALDLVAEAERELNQLAEPPADPDKPERSASDIHAKLAAARNNAFVVGTLLAERDEDTTKFLLDLVNAAGAPAPTPAARVVAADVLLACHLIDWDALFATMQSDEDFGHAMARALARDRDASVQSQLTDEQLGALWSWLNIGWSASTDTFKDGFVSEDDQVREWRNQLVAELEKRATPTALAVLAALVAEHPDNYRLRSALHNAELRDHDESWQAPQPDELTALLADPRRTIVHDADSLYRIVLASLERFAARMKHVGQMLWNETRAEPADGMPTTKVWAPKYEPDVSAAIKDHLESEFGDRLVLNREVLVRQTTSKGHGLSVDILASGGGAATDASAQRPLPTCPIEVKCSWNGNLLTDLEAQLVKDYLPAANATRGIYVCAWFPPDQWDDKADPRHSAAAARNRDAVARDLDEAARAASAGGELEVSVVIIDIPRPTPSARRGKKTKSE